MAGDMHSRRQRAADAVRTRRGELSLSQDELAAAAGVSPKTVYNLENGRWPHATTRARIERALQWPPGEIHRLASPPQPDIDPQLIDRARELSDDEKRWMADWLLRQLAADPPDSQFGSAAAGQ